MGGDTTNSMSATSPKHDHDHDHTWTRCPYQRFFQQELTKRSKQAMTGYAPSQSPSAQPPSAVATPDSFWSEGGMSSSSSSLSSSSSSSSCLSSTLSPWSASQAGRSPGVSITPSSSTTTLAPPPQQAVTKHAAPSTTQEDQEPAVFCDEPEDLEVCEALSHGQRPKLTLCTKFLGGF